MQITDIQIIPIIPKNGILAFASVIIDECLYLSSIAIMTRPNGGLRLVYPTKKTANKDFGIFYPIRKNFAQHIEKEVIKHFKKVTTENDRYNRADSA